MTSSASSSSYSAGGQAARAGRGRCRPARACALGSGRTPPARDDVPDRFGGPVAAHDAGAAAQELLHLALVAVAVAVALAEQRRDPLVLAQSHDRLARREVVAVAGRLELAVVDRAAEAQLLEHLGR